MNGKYKNLSFENAVKEFFHIIFIQKSKWGNEVWLWKNEKL